MNELNEKEFKSKITKLISIGILIFIFGFFVGNYVNFNAISSIQGYLMKSLRAGAGSNDNATDANATDANATDANATDANATDANATDANATDANATDANATDSNISNNRLKITLTASKEISQEVTISVEVVGDGFKHIVLPSEDKVLKKSTKYTVTKNGTYYFYTYDIYGGMYSNSIKITNIDRTSPAGTCSIVNKTIFVNASDINKIKEYRYTINNSDNIIISKNSTYNYHTKITSAKVDIVDIAGNVGQVVCKINQNLEEEKKDYNYKNTELTAAAIKEIKDSPVGTRITITAYDDPIIPSTVFDSIKNQDKYLTVINNKDKWEFDGKKIVESKAIDTTFTINNVSEDKELSKKISSGYVVSFAENEKLPGVVNLKIYATDSLINAFKDNEIFVYKYISESSDFKLINSAVQLDKEGFYNLELENCSKLIILDDNVENFLVQGTDKTVSFIKSNSFYILLIIAGILVITFTAIMIYIIKRKNDKNQNFNF